MPKGMGPRGAWVFLDLPRESVETFGTKARVAVRLTVGGKAFRVSVFPDGQGGHQLNFNKAMQAATGWSEGKAVKVVVEADPKPRIVVVPKDLKAALAGDAKAKAYFDRLTPSHRKAYVEWIAEAKRPETRAIRVAETVARLKKSQKFW